MIGKTNGFLARGTPGFHERLAFLGLESLVNRKLKWACCVSEPSKGRVVDAVSAM